MNKALTDIEVLQQGDLILMPFDPHDEIKYIMRLASLYRYHATKSEETVVDIIDRYGRIFWKGEIKGESVGIIYLTYEPSYDEWQLHAYADMEVLKRLNPKGDYSYRAGRLAIQYFFDKFGNKYLYTVHNVANRAATIMCKRLGFTEMGRRELTGIGNCIAMSIERGLWATFLQA